MACTKFPKLTVFVYIYLLHKSHQMNHVHQIAWNKVALLNWHLLSIFISYTILHKLSSLLAWPHACWNTSLAVHLNKHVSVLLTYSKFPTRCSTDVIHSFVIRYDNSGDYLVWWCTNDTYPNFPPTNSLIILHICYRQAINISSYLLLLIMADINLLSSGSNCCCIVKKQI